MNPILFAKNENDFTTNGLGRLECISCKVIEERNGMYELEAEVPVTGIHSSEIEMLSIIGAIPCDGGSLQAFVVYKITKPINGRFMVYARHISYRLSDIPARPFSVTASPQACAQTLAGLKSNATEPCPFTFSTDVTTGNPYNQTAPASIRQRLGGVEGSVLDQFGGEYEWDNFTVYLHKVRGRLANVTGISLRYGKNITDINQEEEIASTVTGIVPYWIDTDGNNLVMLTGQPTDPAVYSQYADNYPYHITQVMDFSGQFQNKPTVSQLRNVATAYVNKTDFGKPKVNIKVSFVNLWETEEYKDIAPLERVKLCDEVNVVFETLGISAVAKVVKTDYDVLKERYNSIEVGNMRTSLAQAVTDRDKDIDTALVEQLTRVNSAIADATSWLTSANGYVVAVKNQDGSWKELLFMDSNDPATALNGIRINNNGIGFWRKSIDGGNVLDGPYTNAWTIDGNLVADFITTGKIKSQNYVYESGNYNTSGSIIDLANGLIRTKGFSVDGNGNVFIANGATIGGYAHSSDIPDVSGFATKTGLASSGYTTINGNNITTGLIKSSNYTDPYSGYRYSRAGTKMNLTDGQILSKSFSLDSTSAQLFVRQLVVKADSSSDDPSLNYFKVEHPSNPTRNVYIDHLNIKVNNVSDFSSGNHTLELGPDYLVIDRKWVQIGPGMLEDRSALSLHPGNGLSICSDDSWERYGIFRSGYVDVKDNDTRVVLFPYQSNNPIFKDDSTTTWYVHWYESDRRIKENIKEIDVSLSVAFIDASEPVSFKYLKKQGKHYGVIAQDVRVLLDSLGETDAELEHGYGKNEKAGGLDDQRTVEYHEYIPHLINYVKDLRETVNKQQKEIDGLKEEIETLKKLIKKGKDIA